MEQCIIFFCNETEIALQSILYEYLNIIVQKCRGLFVIWQVIHFPIESIFQEGTI